MCVGQQIVRAQWPKCVRADEEERSSFFRLNLKDGDARIKNKRITKLFAY